MTNWADESMIGETRQQGEEFAHSKRSGNTLRRNVNDLVMRNGEVQESKLFACLYKIAGLWLLVQYADKALNDWLILVILLSTGIAPDLVKKVLTMKLKP